MKFKKNIYFFLSLTLVICAFGCGPRSSETTPEMAQRMLKLQGYNFTEPEFFRAIRMENAPVVHGFLQAGINPNAKNKEGETALTFAIQNSVPKVVGVLLEKADPNMRDDRGNSPLHLAITKDKEEVVNALLEKNVDVNAAGVSGEIKNQTPLYAAVIKARADLVQKLLEKGADPNIPDSDGGFPLSEAAIRGNAELVKLLLDKGANINAQEPNKRTALIYVASGSGISSQKRQETVRLLLERGADKSIKDEKSMTALDWAKKSNNQDAVELLK
ncbi:MAG TPA: ankyrin repeat domain-containing protein [Pyrinomonadaceae bacterium]|nr:ankyrin repeat domain-containing protein [Pyrinomonadaceae bacterium]